MNMTVVRYINNQPYRGEELPAIEVDNPGVIMVLKDLQRRLIRTGEKETKSVENGKFVH